MAKSPTFTKCPPMPARGLMLMNGIVFPRTAHGGQVASGEGATRVPTVQNWTPWKPKQKPKQTKGTKP